MRFFESRTGIILYFLLLPFLSSGQVKFEKETRIEKFQVPDQAVAFIDSCFVRKKVKWYREESQEGVSIEAKAKLGNHLYSIEFDTLGCIQDVEKKIPFNSLERGIKEPITQTLSEKFSSYRIQKTQVQWQATNSTLQALVQSGLPASDFSVKYELIVKGRDDQGSGYFEMLFNDRGLLEKTYRIIDRPTANLDF